MTGEIETVDLIETWLYATLSADGTLAALVGDRISNALSSALLEAPYVTFIMQSSRDVVGHSGDRISTDNLYQVKGVSRDGSYDEARAIGARITALLHRPATNIGVAGGSLNCIREQIIEYPEVQDAIQYRHLGGIFRIRASADQ